MKKNPSRYWSTGIEGEWQPGSGKRVLRNLKGITRFEQKIQATLARIWGEETPAVKED
jgi:hypothetical protein